MSGGTPLAAPSAVGVPVPLRADASATRLLSRGALVAAVALAVAILALGAWPVGLLQDDGMYVTLGKSLATGEGYRFLNLPGHPAATHFPPGYPVLLALIWKIAPSFPGNVAAFRFANAGLLAVAAWATYRLVRDRGVFGENGATVAVLLATVSIPALTLAGAVMSEVMFMAALLGALIVAERAVEQPHRGWAIAAGTAVAGVALVRTIGIVALVAPILLLLMRRRWRDAMLVAVAGILVLAPWFVWVSRHAGDVPPILVGKYGSYGAWLTDGVRVGGVSYLAAVARVNLRDLVGVFGTMLAPERMPWLLVGAAPVLVLLAVGARVVAKQLPVALTTLALYLAIVVLWPYEPHRFVWAVWPLIAILAVAGARQLLGVTGTLRRYARITVAVVVAAYVARLATNVSTRDWEQTQRDGVARAAPLAEWVLANTRPDEVIATDDELFVHLYTGRLTIPNGGQRPEDRVRAVSPDAALTAMRALLDAYHPAYLLAAYAPPIVAASTLVQEAPPRLRFTAALSKGAVFSRAEGAP